MIESISNDRFLFIDFFANELGRITKYNKLGNVEKDRIRRIISLFGNQYDIDEDLFNARKDSIYVAGGSEANLEFIFVSGVKQIECNDIEYFLTLDSQYKYKTIIVFEDMFKRWFVDIHTRFDDNMNHLKETLDEKEQSTLFDQSLFYTVVLHRFFDVCFMPRSPRSMAELNLIGMNVKTSIININIDSIIILGAIKRAIKKANPFEDTHTIDRYMKHVVYNTTCPNKLIADATIDIINIIDSDKFQELPYIDKQIELLEHLRELKKLEKLIIQ